MQKTTTINAEQATEIQNNGNPKRGRGKAKHAGCFLNAIYNFQTTFADGITADNLFDSRTEKIICGQADRLICTGLFPQHEREDLQQILRLALLHEMSNFVSGSDRYTFASNVACNYGKNLIARRAAEREATNGAVLSLDETMPGGDTMGDMLENEREISPVKSVILKESVALLLSRLGEIDRKICEGILAGASLRDLEKDEEIGLKHNSICHRLSHFILPVALECGLGQFFGLGGDGK